MLNFIPKKDDTHSIASLVLAIGLIREHWLVPFCSAYHVQPLQTPNFARMMIANEQQSLNEL
jgi:hypothetical protein